MIDMDAVLVCWEDPHDEDHAPWSDALTEAPCAYLVWQIGFVAFEDDEHLVLTSGYSRDRIQRRFVLPKRIIKQVVKLDGKAAPGRRSLA